MVVSQDQVLGAVSWIGSSATSISRHRASCGIACGADVSATPTPSSAQDTSHPSVGSASYRVPSPKPPHPGIADPEARSDKSPVVPSPQCPGRPVSNSVGHRGTHAPAVRADGDQASPKRPTAACRSNGSRRSHHAGEIRRTRTPIADAKIESSAVGTALAASPTQAVRFP